MILLEKSADTAKGGENVKIKLSKKYIEQHYKNALMDYTTACDDDERWVCRKIMASLERDAMEYYGFEYADELKKNLPLCLIGGK